MLPGAARESARRPRSAWPKRARGWLSWPGAQEKLDQAAQDIRAATEGVVLPLSADVSHPDTAERVVQTALDNYGRVDILVNNAGVSPSQAL